MVCIITGQSWAIWSADSYAIELVALRQQEHQQPIIIDAALAHLLSPVEDRHRRAIEGALDRHVVKLRPRKLDRGVPGEGEHRIGRAAAQGIGRLLGHPDMRGGMADAAAIGEMLDKGALPVRRPPVRAQPRRGGEEAVGQRGALAALGFGIRIGAELTPEFGNACGYIIHA